MSEPDSGLANVRAAVQEFAPFQPRHAAANLHFRGQWGACAGLKRSCLASSLLTSLSRGAARLNDFDEGHVISQQTWQLESKDGIQSGDYLH